MKAEHEASRLAIAATGLLTVIFLQQGYSNDLPPTAPVALMDKIYGLAFAVVFIRSTLGTTDVDTEALGSLEYVFFLAHLDLATGGLDMDKLRRTVGTGMRMLALCPIRAPEG